MKIHHVGIVCKNIEDTIQYFKSLYNIIEISEVIHDDLQNADLCIIKTDTGLDVEFISGPQVINLLKSKITYYHLCYSVDNLEKTIEHFENNGAIIVSSPKPAILFNGKRVAFLMTKTGLIEFLEE